MRGLLRVGLGLCEPGAYPWDEWATRARAAGVSEDLVQTGRDLVLQVAIDWLREGPTGAVCVALLELVARHAPGPAVLRIARAGLGPPESAR